MNGFWFHLKELKDHGKEKLKRNHLKVLMNIPTTVITIVKPLKQTMVLPKRQDIDLSPTPQLIWWGGAVIIVTLLLYAIFW